MWIFIRNNLGSLYFHFWLNLHLFSLPWVQLSILYDLGFGPSGKWWLGVSLTFKTFEGEKKKW